MRISFFLFIALLTLGCEDTKTKKNVLPSTASKTPSALKDTIPPAPPKPALGTLGNPFIKSQAEVKDFLTNYGKENPETRVRLNTDFGSIELELFKDTPLHRANFIFLVKEGYFDLSQFHRVSLSFVDQFGNSDSYALSRKRSGIGKYLLPNESKSKYTHKRGALAAAKFREQNVSNASSPFENYIVVPKRGAHHLNGLHTVFGRVTKGMQVVEKINDVPVDQTEWPLKNIHLTAEIIE